MSLAVNMTSAAAVRIWLVVLQLFTTPLVVTLLGPEQYGLFGFAAAITMFLACLDGFVSPSLTRELSRLGGGTSQQAATLLRSLEAVSLATAVLLGVAIFLAAPWLAAHAIASSSIPETEVVSTLRLLGFFVAVQWPTMLYIAGFTGLQRQDIPALLRAAAGTVMVVGGVLMLWLVHASAAMYLAWLGSIGLLLTIAMRVALWRLVPKARSASVDFLHLRRLWRFGVDNLFLNVTASLLAFLPTMFVAQYVSLAELAAWTLALMMAQQLSAVLSEPLISALGPHFTRLHSRGDQAALVREYHRCTQLAAAAVLPIGATLIWFLEPLLRLWLGAHSPLIEPVVELLPWIVVSTVLSTFVALPRALQFASGWTSLAVGRNVLSLIVSTALLLIFVPRYGAYGAALCLLLVHLGYFLIEIPLTHCRLLKQEHLTWYARNTLVPIAATVVLYSTTAGLLDRGWHPLAEVFVGGIYAVLAWGLLAATLPWFRDELTNLARFVLPYFLPVKARPR